MRDFVSLTAQALNIPLHWQGERGGGRVRLIWRAGAPASPSTRPCSARQRWGNCAGDSRKARDRLGWSPTIDLPALITLMVKDEQARQQRTPTGHNDPGN